MKIAPGTPLEVTLQWDDRTAMPVGRLAYRDGQAWLEYTPDFLASGLQLSPLHHQAGPGLETAWKRDVFEGLHGMFADSLPDGWGRLLVDRRARQLGFEPSQLTPRDLGLQVVAAGQEYFWRQPSQLTPRKPGLQAARLEGK